MSASGRSSAASAGSSYEPCSGSPTIGHFVTSPPEHWPSDSERVVRSMSTRISRGGSMRSDQGRRRRRRKGSSLSTSSRTPTAATFRPSAAATTTTSSGWCRSRSGCWSAAIPSPSFRRSSTDPPAIADLKARLAATGGWERHVEQVIEPQLTTVDELLRFLCSADIVVATRFHAIVLALALARPVIAFSNHSKMDQAMSEMGQEAYVFRADEADTEVLGEAFDRLEANLGAIGAELEERASDHRALLEGQLDQLFGQRRDGLTAAALPVVAGVPRR